MTRIIDFRLQVPMPEYAPEGRQTRGAEHFSNYTRVYGTDRPQSLDYVVEMMEEAGVELGVLQAEWGFGDYRILNAAVGRAVAKHKKLIGFCTVNPGENDDMAAVVQSAVDEWGARGVNLQPYAYRLRCNDKRFYPMYSKARELGLIVTVHCSINFSSNRPLDLNHPRYLDEVACDFPGLKLVANHGGWPWVNDMVAIAWKHPNVFIEIGGVSPKYIGRPGTGWDTLMTYGNSLLADRVLFATDSMLPTRRCLEELDGISLKPDVKEKWLGLNAAALLGV
jgi:predicted TIM-barrel fold metal-dependent hydrolase